MESVGMTWPADDAKVSDVVERFGIDPREPHWVTHFFFFGANRDGGDAAVHELMGLGCSRTDMDEESAGDNYWHVTAWRLEPLTSESIEGARAEMEELAATCGGTYDGWDITLIGPDRRLPDRTLPHWER